MRRTAIRCFTILRLFANKDTVPTNIRFLWKRITGRELDWLHHYLVVWGELALEEQSRVIHLCISKARIVK